MEAMIEPLKNSSTDTKTGLGNYSFIFQQDEGKLMLPRIALTGELHQFDEPLCYEDALELEKKFYELNKEMYVQQYEGKYIALLNGEVIGEDTDYSALAKRVFEESAYDYNTPIYIPLVVKQEKPIKLATPSLAARANPPLSPPKRPNATA